MSMILKGSYGHSDRTDILMHGYENMNRLFIIGEQSGLVGTESVWDRKKRRTLERLMRILIDDMSSTCLIW